MKVSVSQEVFKKFHPKLRIAFIYIKGINNKKNLHESEHLLHEVEELIRLELHPETLKNHDLIAPWVVAQQEFGKEAKHYHTSVEKMIKLVVSNKSVKVKNTLGNILNYVSLKHVVPVGVDDFNKISHELKFEIAKGKEKINALTFLKKGAFFYYDQAGVLGTKFDYWKSSRTLIDEDTKSALIHVEVVPPIKKEEFEEILSEMQNLIKTFCGGESKVFILDRNSDTFDLKN